MSRILIIEDDRSIAELERDYLEINGFETTICDDGNEASRRPWTAPMTSSSST